MQIGQGPIEMPDVDFQSLEQPPPIDNELLSKIDNNIKSSNWVASHYCVTVLRQINKFQPNYIPDVVTKYSSSILDLFSTGKTQIMKNLLRMVKQIFDMGQTVNVEAAVYAFLPILLKKSSREIGHIKQMSQMVLASFSENCGYDSSFVIAATYCCQIEEQNLNQNNKQGMDVQMAEMSLKLLTRLIQVGGQGFMQLNPKTLEIIMAALSALIEGKRPNFKNRSLDVCMIIYGLIGSENYLSLMNYTLKPEQVQAMGCAMETHRVTNKSTHIPLRTVLQARKTQVNPLNMHNQNMHSQNMYSQNMHSQPNQRYNNCSQGLR